MDYHALSQQRDVRFPPGMADVRGYDVRTRDDDEKVGKVNDLIVSHDGQIRYLDIDAGGFFNPKRVLLPIGAAEADTDRDVVWIAGTKDAFKDLPDYVGDTRTIDDDYETSVRGRYAGRESESDLYDQGRFYAGSGNDAREARLILSEEQLEIGRKQVQAGEVGIRKTVETEHVRETVPVMHEEVTIERRPVSADAHTDAEIGEDEVRIPVMREEIVTEKRVVPKEEVVLKKHAVKDDRVVEGEVRRERLDVDDQDRGLIANGGELDDRDIRDRTDRGGRGVGKRIADAADDLKDRVDGNPASRPGPDATDRDSRI
jgi:uncharacterized protein (TIGR02271 family)